MRRMVGGSLATVSLAPHADEKPGAFPTHSRSLPRSLLYTKHGHVWVRATDRWLPKARVYKHIGQTEPG